MIGVHYCHRHPSFPRFVYRGEGCPWCLDMAEIELKILRISLLNERLYRCLEELWQAQRKDTTT